MSARSYHQYCGLAAALDLLGERWTLLVLRELVLGPKRFRALMDALPGIGTNLLSARLRTLEEADVIRRVELPAPAVGVHAYELTARGEALRPSIEGLALWGLDLLPDEVGDRRIRPAWAAACMRAGVSAQDAAALRGTFSFHVAGEQFHVRARDGDVQVADGPPPDAADVTVTCGLDAYLALGVRAMTVAQAVAAGAAEVEGDAARLDELLEVFHLRVPALR